MGFLMKCVKKFVFKIFVIWFKFGGMILKELFVLRLFIGVGMFWDLMLW